MEMELKTLMTFEVTDIAHVYLSKKGVSPIENNTQHTQDDIECDNLNISEGIATCDKTGNQVSKTFDAVLLYDSNDTLLAYAHLLTELHLGGSVNESLNQIRIRITVSQGELTLKLETRTYAKYYKDHSIEDSSNISELRKNYHFKTALITNVTEELPQEPIKQFQNKQDKHNNLIIQTSPNEPSTDEFINCSEDIIRSRNYKSEGKNYSKYIKFALPVSRALYELDIVGLNDAKDLANLLVTNTGKLFSDEIHGLYLSLIIDRNIIEKVKEFNLELSSRLESYSGVIFIGTNDYKFVEFYRFQNYIKISDDYIVFRHFNNIYLYSNNITRFLPYNQIPIISRYVTGVLMSGANSVVKAKSFFIDVTGASVPDLENVILPEFVDITQIGYDTNSLTYLDLANGKNSDLTEYLSDVVNLNSPMDFNPDNLTYNYIENEKLKTNSRTVAILGMSYVEYFKNFVNCGTNFSNIRLLSSFAARIDKTNSRILVYPYNVHDEVLRQRKSITCNIADYRIESNLDYLYVINKETGFTQKCDLKNIFNEDWEVNWQGAASQNKVVLTYKGVEVVYDMLTCEVTCNG